MSKGNPFHTSAVLDSLSKYYRQVVDKISLRTNPIWKMNDGDIPPRDKIQINTGPSALTKILEKEGVHGWHHNSGTDHVFFHPDYEPKYSMTGKPLDPRVKRLWKFSTEFKGNLKPGHLLSWREVEQLTVEHPDIWAEYEDEECPGL